MKVKFKKLAENAVIPTKGSEGAAAFDLYVCKDCYVDGLQQVIPTGIAIELPHGYMAEVRPRSGISSKGLLGYLTRTGIEISANCAHFPVDVILGTIDEDYRGEIGIIIHKHCSNKFWIRKGTRLAQLLIHQIPEIEFVEVEELSDSERGTGGYGSSGN